jgi:hypothetical protein
MKNVILLLFVATIFSCKPDQKIEKPSWLFGKWERVNEKPNKRTYDFWHKDLTGLGFTIQENDTVFKEIMSIVNLKDTLYLKVSGVNETPTLFKFTSQTDTSFVCENKKNEFPKIINYYKENNQLKCKISNDEFSVDFIFNEIKHE